MKALVHDRRRPSVRALAVAGILAVVLAACGSSSKSKAAPQQAAPSSHAAAGSPVVVGYVCSCSGAFASSIAISVPIIKAWADYENARGGLDGHPIDLVVKDDALNPGTSLSEVTALVEQDHALAIIDGSDVDSAWGSFVQAHGVPVLGGNLSSTLMFTNPDFFPAGQTINTLAPSIAAAAKRAGVTKLGVVYCSSDPVCAQLAPPIKAAGKAVGVDVVYAGPISSSAPNYTAPCLAAKQAGADGIFVGQASAVVVSFAESCAAQGYQPTYIAEDGAVATSFLSAPPLEHFVGIQNDLPAFVTSNPAVAAMTKAIDRYEPGTTSSPDYGPAATQTWAAGLLLAKAAEVAPLGSTPTPAQVIAGLDKLHDETLGGMAPPLSFTPGKPTTISCWFYMGIKAGHFDMPYGSAPACSG
jgi:branched-chain amino acid transport system substrate-binding protein